LFALSFVDLPSTYTVLAGKEVKQKTLHNPIQSKAPNPNFLNTLLRSVRSDHKAVVAYADQSQCPQVKTTTKLVYRRRTPSQHAAFLQYAADLDFGLAREDVGSKTYSPSFWLRVHN